MPSLTIEAPLAKGKDDKKLDGREPLDQRVLLLAGKSWVERVEAAAVSLGLSNAAFIRMACEKEMKRMKGESDE